MKVIKYKIIPIVICIIIIISVICVPVFAASFSPLPVNTTDPYYSANFYNTGASIALYSLGGDIRFNAFQLNTYVYAIPKQTRNTAITNYDLIVATTNTPTDNRLFGYSFSYDYNIAYRPSGYITNTDYEENIYYYYLNELGNGNGTATILTDSPYIKIVNSLEDAFNDLLYGIQINPEPISVTLPAGNALVIEYTGNCTYRFETVVSQPTVQVAYGLNGIKVGYTNTFPDIVNYTDNYLSETDFSGFGSTNVYGQYYKYEKSGSFAIESPIGAKYFVILNPLWGYSNNDMVVNPSISITASAVNGYWIYPLNTQLSDGGWINESNEDLITYNYDPDSQEWIGTDQNGNPANPTVGGVNVIPEAKTITEWLENIVDTLTDFFKGPINAINVLIQNLSGFVNSLKSLYMWLPSPVYSLLTSAIMVAITIGVIKIFI